MSAPANAPPTQRARGADGEYFAPTGRRYTRRQNPSLVPTRRRIAVLRRTANLAGNRTSTRGRRTTSVTARLVPHACRAVQALRSARTGRVRECANIGRHVPGPL